MFSASETIIIIAAFFTSILSGVIGMGGGILLLTVMAQFFEAKVLIPIHGVVQFFSNSSRAYFNYQFVNKKLLIPFSIGALFGAIGGNFIVIQIPENIFQILIALFILTMTWLPKAKREINSRYQFAALGLFASFLSLILGATGPLIAPFFLKKKLGQREIVGTKAACQLVIHFFKTLVFLNIGFLFGNYLPLLGALVFAVIIGTRIGTALLGRIPEKIFVWAFRILITLLAVRILVNAALLDT